MNPFEMPYYNEQLDFYDFDGTYSSGDCTVTQEAISGCDGYLNKDLLFTEFKIPILRIKGQTWMSITPMEVQSLYLAIKRSRGRVGTTGLGLGYLPLAVANKDTVDSVDVYESNKDVIEFFTESFKHRPEFLKINIIYGDAKKKCVEQEYDYLFLDHYQSQACDAMPDDLIYFEATNLVTDADFWTWERIVFDAVHEFNHPGFIDGDDEGWYFSCFLMASFEIKGRTYKNSSLYRQVISEHSYLRKCLVAMGRWEPSMDKWTTPLADNILGSEMQGSLGGLKL